MVNEGNTTNNGTSSSPVVASDTTTSLQSMSIQKQQRCTGPAAALRAFVGLSCHFWWDAPRRVRVESSLRLALVVAVMLLRGRASTFLSAERRKQVNTMLSAGGSDRGAILQGLLRYLGTLFVLSPVNKAYWRLLRGLRQQWTEHLTTHFLTTFVDTQCLTYGGGSCSRAPGNDHGAPETLPDQHISRDVSVFVQLATSLSLETLQALIHLYFYTKLLASIAPSLSRVVVLAACSGTLLARALGRRLPELYAAERHAEGHFTYSLTRIRENAESIAFYRGQPPGDAENAAPPHSQVVHRMDQMARKDVVQWFSATYRQLLGLVPAYVLAGRMLTPTSQPSAEASSWSGTDVGAVAQAREAFDEVLYHLLILAENTSDFSRLATVSLELYDRDLQSRSVLEAVRTKQGQESQRLVLEDIQVDQEQQSWLQIRDLTLFAPGHPPRLLLKSLSLTLAPDSGGILITGRSGAGKTTLLRAIAGIWLSGSGRISRVDDRSRVMFLPQKPYLQGGTLLEEVLYPNLLTKQRAEEKEEVVRAALQRVGLSKLLQRLEADLGASRRWADELSLGEQQRLSVARILVNKPEFVILDEITSANDLQHEEVLYRLIQNCCRSFVSVGHRESLLQFHARRLKLKGEDEGGEWSLEELRSAAR
eukprot:CAMPEP_0206605648 /NCGR_PEP_ID=MMETSP0325_2-20121206/50590_1 /ASSEMBLY_ACC=CAM_ASM_000347 /TAXON_ID=2866 /ORGANISM="Crypthecodinium cohnii, Strain Seligo" /LENGTH=649 /DNA_ID=CAMNT_0054121331 /DNA_START=44 /DNA_END=1991 /DNA_ORIENTATION=-